MKYQKSSIPYLSILALFLFGLPLTDYKVSNDLVLEISVVPIDRENNKAIVSDKEKRELLTHSMVLTLVK